MDEVGAGEGREPADGGRLGKVGAYRLLARLGAGGMGEVFLARSARGRTVAVKVVRRELAAQHEFRARFRQEVQAARRVGGQWTAPVLDADTEAEIPWVATGYVAGPSLQQVVGRDHGPLPERSVRILAAGLAHALRDIHRAGLVHRDLKPSNVMVTIDGPRVIDFGIARALESLESSDEGITSTGALVGSPGFMSPEQVRGDTITPACDVFCLGSVLAYAATGQLPFGSARSGAHALMFRIAEEAPDLTGIPESLADLVRDCLQKNPQARPGLGEILERTGAEDTVTEGRARDPWLPGALVAQLGRHAVRLLETENPEETDGLGHSLDAAASAAASAAGPTSGPAEGPAPGSRPGAVAASHPAGQGPAAAPPGSAAGPPPPGAPGAAPVSQLPTQVHGSGSGPLPPTPPPGLHPSAGHRPAAAPPHYGYPHPAPAPAAHHNGYPAVGYSTAPHGPYSGTRPDNRPPARGSRGTLALAAVAVVVALGAGGSVYALMNQDGTEPRGGPTDGPSGDGSSSGQGSGSPGGNGGNGGGPDRIPEAFLGTWEGSITGDQGENTRVLKIVQGGAGERVLTLTADGPAAGGGSYHCVFDADLKSVTGEDVLAIGPSEVSVGRPLSSCTPGADTTVTLLPDGTLERVNDATGESLTYRRSAG